MHPHDGERVLAWEFAAWAGAFVAEVVDRDDHPVGRCSRSLALAPQQCRAGIAREGRPARRPHELERSAERGLVGRQLLDFVFGQAHGRPYLRVLAEREWQQATACAAGGKFLTTRHAMTPVGGDVTCSSNRTTRSTPSSCTLCGALPG